MIGGRNVRKAQDRNALVRSRLGAQLGTVTVTAPRKRFFGGPLALPASPAAPATAMTSSRLLLQSKQVADQLSLGATIAGPGSIQ